MARRYDEFLAAGVRIVGVSVDPVPQNAAMVEKLHLPFWMLSDPGGKDLLDELGAYNPDERGGIGRPGVFVVPPDGSEHFRQVGRDFADRITEDELLAVVVDMELPPTEQPDLELVDPEPGETAMPVHALIPYCRGAKFAAKAMGLRHPAAKDDADRLFDQMDGYMRVVREFREATGA